MTAKTIKLTHILMILSLLSLVMVVAYFLAHTDKRNELWLKTYPVRAKLSYQQHQCSNNAPSWLNDIVSHQVFNGNSLSNQIAYLSPTGELFHCENGYMDEYPILSKPIHQNTRFRYASVTKLWTSDATLDLIKQQKLSFDTKLADVLTEIKSPKDKRILDITIGQLLLHRAGFDRYTIFGHDMFGIGEDICPNHLDKLNHIQLNFTPNEKMSYSNLGYCLLGAVVARLNHQDYTKIIHQQYQLDKTTLLFIDNYKMTDEVFTNYVEKGLFGVGDVYTAFDYTTVDSSAGLSGNAIDLVKQVKEMTKKTEPNILSLNHELACDLTKIGDCYGYAMFPYQQANKNLKVYFRDGGLLGWSSLVVVDSYGGITTLLSNGRIQNNEEMIKKQIYKNLLRYYEAN